jgi:PAS domain S-box-containing protein
LACGEACRNHDAPVSSLEESAIDVGGAGATAWPFRRDERRMDLRPFDELWDLVPSALALSDPSGLVLRANQPYYDLYGYGADEILGHDFAVIFPEDYRDEAREIYREVFAGETVPEPIESKVQRRDGSEAWVEARVAFVNAPDGTRVAMLNLIRDITEAKRAQGIAAVAESARDQIQLLEHEATSAAQQQRELFLATVTHNLLNPLSAIKGDAQLIVRRAAAAEASEIGELARSIDETVEQMTGQIRELNDLALAEAGQLHLELEAIDLVELVGSIVEAYRPAVMQRLEFQTRETSIVGRWDRNRLRQSIVNLLVNAAKYSPAHTTVEIRVDLQHTDHGNEASIEIEDHGAGMSDEVLGQVFEPFYRAPDVRGSVPGTGLGLGSAQRFVELQGGRISVRSEVAKGTTFTILLPMPRG